MFFKARLISINGNAPRRIFGLMKKRWFLVIALLTILGLLGIIALQAYWIRQSWKLKEQEFDQAVMNSLDRVSEQVTERKVVRILNSIPETYVIPQLPLQVYEERQTVRHMRNRRNQETVNTITSIEISDLDSLETRTIQVSQHLEELEADVKRLRVMGRQLGNEMRREFKSDPIPNEDNLLRITRFTSNIVDTLRESGIFKPMQMVEDIVSNVIIRLDSDSSASMLTLSDTQMTHILTTELQQKNIHQPFRYRVVNDLTGDTLLSGDTLSGGDWGTSAYQVNLAGTEGNYDRLMLYFPGKRNYIWQSMAGIISVSVVLSLLALFGVLLLLRWITRQQQLAAMKTQFINNMTHEFKTPLATTLVAANTLNNPKVYTNPEQVKYYTDLIKEENRLMNRHIETVLQAALLDKNKLALNSEPVLLNELLKRTVESLHLQLEQAGADLQVHLPGQHLYTLGDADHIQQVVSNLVLNAIKYTEQKPVIHIELKPEKKTVQILVSDNGIGIPKKDQKHIFDPFYRVHTGNLYTVKGFGLGLNYVKKIMASHKGSVSVASEPGKGSAFTLTFQRYEQ